MDNELLKKLAKSERLNKVAVLTHPDQAPLDVEDAYNQLRSLRQEDADFDTVLRDRLLKIAIQQK